MKARGWTLLSRQDVKVDSLPGILVHFEQPALGQVFLKWSLAFGDDRKTAMVTATFPKVHGREFSARLKLSYLALGWTGPLLRMRRPCHSRSELLES